MQKYFISPQNMERKVITGEDVFHITTVMRCHPGDEIAVCDGVKSYIAAITSMNKNEVSFEIRNEKIGNSELPVFVSLFQGYPKGDKLEDIIKHGTELGIREVVPTVMKRSIAKPDPKKMAAKTERFNKIAKEAAEQSDRMVLPVVRDAAYLKTIDFSSFDHKIICYEEDAKSSELTAFKSIVSKMKKGDRVAIVVGPEGGIDPEEITCLKDKGFVSCGLGPRILRTETAVFYCLSAISYEMELKK